MVINFYQSGPSGVLSYLSATVTLLVVLGQLQYMGLNCRGLKMYLYTAAIRA